jgi:hypothetical protein
MPSVAHHTARPNRRSVAAVAAILTVLSGWGVHQAPVAQAATADKIAVKQAQPGTGIFVTGTGLNDATAVSFVGTTDPADDVAAPHFIAMDPKKLAVQVPAGAATGPIAVTTPTGTVTTPVSITILKQPRIDALSTTWGSPGSTLTITGDNLLGEKKPVIALGAKKLAPLLGSTQAELRVSVPTGLPGGTAPLSVTTTGGSASTTFYVGPAVKAITPAMGTSAGGTVASIVGMGFTGVDGFEDDAETPDIDESLDGVTIGGERVTKLIAVRDTEVVVEVPPGTDPAADVVVRTTDGSTVAESGTAVKFAYRPLPAVTSLSQNWNAINDPSEIVVEGVNLTETTGVFVGSLKVTDVVADPDAGTLTFTPPMSVKAAPTMLTFTNVAAGVTYKATTPFAYVTTPVVTKLVPATGPAGTSVTISGTSFGSGTEAFFGDTEAMCTVVSFLALRCVAPPGADVTEVTVDNGVGTSGATATTRFTYTEDPLTPAPVVGLPNVTTLLPAYGATGSTVDVRGANVHTATSFEFTGPEDTWVEADGMLVVGPGRVVVTVPEEAVTGEVRVKSPVGTVESLGRIFTKTVRPRVTSIDVVGDTLYAATPGDLLKIQGSGLFIKGAKTEVTIGGKPAPILAKPVPNAKTIVVRVPLSAGGRAAVTLYYVPEVKAVKPMTYSRAGGTVTTINGVGFTGVDSVTVAGGRRSAVTFGGVRVGRMVFMSDKSIIVTTGRGSASADPIVVTSQHDGRFGTSDGKTRSVDAPIASITSVSPDTGPTGTTPPPVTITGEHLKTTSVVKFGANTATVQSAADDGTSMVVIPPSRPTTATVGITITNMDDGEQLSTTVADAYTYVLQPATITGLSVSTAVPGSQVTVSGTSFVNVSSVRFGSIEVAYTVVNPSTIFVTVPATPSGAAGTLAEISVVNGTGQSSTASPATANDWTWDNSPTLVSLSASTGAAGSTITINGSNFVGVTRVRFGYTDATSYTVVNQNTITAVVPATPGGAGGQVVDVVVEIGDLVSRPVNAAADNWTWMAPAVVTAMTHSTAPAGTTVTVTGTGFTDISAVQIHTKQVTSYTVLSDTSLTFVVPPSDATGPTSSGSKRDVRIYNGSGLVSTASPATADDWTFQ